jgi:hypothetical protein
MKNRLWVVVALLAAMGVVSAPVFAHHGAAAYDTDKSVTVQGVVTAFDFTNPHVLITMDVKNDKGVVEKWQGELTSPNHLSRAGWSRSTIKVGDRVTMVGNPAKSGANSVWIRKVTGPDGKDLSTGGGGDN